MNLSDPQVVQGIIVGIVVGVISSLIIAVLLGLNKKVQSWVSARWKQFSRNRKVNKLIKQYYIKDDMYWKRDINGVVEGPFCIKCTKEHAEPKAMQRWANGKYSCDICKVYLGKEIVRPKDLFEEQLQAFINYGCTNTNED